MEAARQDNESYVTIQWSRLTYMYTGNEFPIQIYNIEIPEINFFEEVGANCSKCSHNLTADGSNVVEFNTTYLVELTAINTCYLKSSPATLNVIILAYGKFTEN